MSKELVGKNGCIVGSERYIETLHKEHPIGIWMQNKSASDYRRGLGTLNDNIGKVIDKVYQDLRKVGSAMSYFPNDQRMQMVKCLDVLAEVCKLGPLKSNQINSSKSILNLSSLETKRHSRESLRTIEEGVKFIQKLGSSGEKAVEALLRSSNYNRTAIGILWLSQDVFRNKDKYFLMDVWDKLQYDKQRGTYKGYNGYGICSSDYIKAIYKEAFGGKLYSSLGSSANASGMKKALENIVQEIKYDLEQGRRNNDYIKDANAKKLKEEINGLKDVGVQVYNLERDITLLAWFVGGDPQKIKDLQKTLNQLGIRGSHGMLKVDGVYGKETHSAWNAFTSALVSGSVPTLSWINPLQSQLTGIQVVNIKNNTLSTLRDVSARSINPKGTTVFRVDTPHGIFQYPHLNTVENRTVQAGQYTASSKQLRNLQKFNHVELSDDAYNVLKNFDNITEPIRAGGRVLLIAGLALDAFELGTAVQENINTTGTWWGKTTMTAIACIGGQWGGGLAGAKVGAMGGAALGTAIMPGAGTVIGGAVGGLALGIAGSVGGGALGNCGRYYMYGGMMNVVSKMQTL